MEYEFHFKAIKNEVLEKISEKTIPPEFLGSVLLHKFEDGEDLLSLFRREVRENGGVSPDRIRDFIKNSKSEIVSTNP